MANTKKINESAASKKPVNKKPAAKKSTTKKAEPKIEETVVVETEVVEVEAGNTTVEVEIEQTKKTSIKEVKVKQAVSNEEKKFNKKVKRRKVGLIMNIFGSSSTFFGWLILLILAVAIILFAKDKYLELLNGLVKNRISDTLEKLIGDAQQGNTAMSADQIFNKIIETIKANGLDFGKKHLSYEQVTDAFGTVFNKASLTQVIQNWMSNGDVELPQTVTKEFIDQLIVKLDLDIFKNMGVALIIVSAFLTVINLLNIIFASRLIVAKAKISKPLFIITSIISINIINLIGMLVFVVNDKKTVF
ncbi:hypothetical protein MENTO_v1c04640 [Mesoplasma entomophilum]|uniref:Uncharacterized protein n=1 Tax=Mesoplasma entomophilum TaxID=2149 RepID=A0A3S5Y0C7_9MOLU|nr:hypothetical protein [Mesoplasma entomophilum]ATQ35600.1 hypothetical protein CS528_02405 [Mesoplasma entomophilum]ATZ19569.1 hypothetical protein MENTO_v1c04640 [Mesoplasma entomophilum]